MFQAIRRQFLRWPAFEMTPARKRRAMRWGGLFAFEFVVVLLGVLAAQMLQEYATKARAREDAGTALEQSKREAATFRATAEYWLAVGPCIEGHLDQLMRAAARGTEDPIAHGPRPHMPFSALTPWSEATIVTVRRAHGETLLADYNGLRMAAERMADDSRELAAEWALLALVDPQFGSVAREDRMNARLAAGRMKGRLRSLQVTAAHAVSTAQRLGIGADPERKRLLALPAGCIEVER